MKSTLPAVLLALCASVHAGALCKRMPMDREVPPGLDGRYEIVGKDPQSGRSYSGSLGIEFGKNSYALVRTTATGAVKGEAWLERCGPDEIWALSARYATQPATELSCSFGTDADNYYRVTCRMRQAAGEWHGLEAWFQTR